MQPVARQEGEGKHLPLHGLYGTCFLKMGAYLRYVAQAVDRMRSHSRAETVTTVQFWSWGDLPTIRASVLTSLQRQRETE